MSGHCVCARCCPGHKVTEPVFGGSSESGRSDGITIHPRQPNLGILAAFGGHKAPCVLYVRFVFVVDLQCFCFVFGRGRVRISVLRRFHIPRVCFYFAQSIPANAVVTT
jgi:hypothetical protein